MENRKIGYARVSSEDQNPALQLDALREAGCIKIFQDNVTGKNRNRPGLEECLNYLRPEDVLVVWKLDRAFRSLRDALNILHEFEAHKIGFQAITNNISITTPMERAFFQIQGAFAELESGLNSERTIAGIEAARRRGVRIGRPPALEPKQIAWAHKLVSRGEISIASAARKLGVNRQTLVRGFRREGLAA